MNHPAKVAEHQRSSPANVSTRRFFQRQQPRRQGCPPEVKRLPVPYDLSFTVPSAIASLRESRWLAPVGAGARPSHPCPPDAVVQADSGSPASHQNPGQAPVSETCRTAPPGVLSSSLRLHRIRNRLRISVAAIQPQHFIRSRDDGEVQGEAGGAFRARPIAEPVGAKRGRGMTARRPPAPVEADTPG